MLLDAALFLVGYEFCGHFSVPLRTISDVHFEMIVDNRFVEADAFRDLGIVLLPYVFFEAGAQTIGIW
jgi:hypothetical protein|tara:strand:+ start:245 stop:448 length:204 start_codon:yes stop_codon:yes gene_type:complete